MPVGEEGREQQAREMRAGTNRDVAPMCGRTVRFNTLPEALVFHQALSTPKGS
jgi:hypothetical protein